MILVDANILIYAINGDSAHHDAARGWLEKALSGHRTVGFPWISILAFLRLTTRSSIFEKPLTVDEALAYVDVWLAQPSARAIGPGPDHWPLLRQLLVATGTAGNLTSDTHLAALALERGWGVCSTDNDFKRFPGLRHENPLG